MNVEIPRTPPPEVKFAGAEKANDIKQGFAITTIRNPRPSYNFSQGQEILADCFESGEKVPVVVLSCETKKLKDFSTAQLALDGFFSAQQVIEEMKTYPGYENLNKDSEITAITFVDEKSYAALPKEIADNIYGTRFDDLVKCRDLRHLFPPSIHTIIEKLPKE